MAYNLKEAVVRVEEAWKTVPGFDKTADLYFEALQGNGKARDTLFEAITTDDTTATLLSGPLTIQRLKAYADYPRVWSSYASERLVSDFGKVQFGTFDLDTSDLVDRDGRTQYPGALSPVGELDEYPSVKFVTAELSRRLAKSGNRVDFSWEAFRNTRDFGLFEELAVGLGQMAARSEEYEAASQLVVSGAVNTDNWNAPNDNLLSGNPTLSLDGLAAAKAHLRGQLVGGHPVPVSKFILIVPPALGETARELLTSTTIIDTSDPTRTIERTATGIVSDVRVVENPYIPLIVGSSAADNFWWLIADLGDQTRPIIQNAFLRGHRDPLLTIKQSGHNSIGGAPVPSLEGTFENDAIAIRERHVVTGIFLSPAGSVFSNGSNS